MYSGQRNKRPYAEHTNYDKNLAATMMLILSQVLLIRETMSLIRFLFLKEDQHRVHLRDNKISSPLPQAKLYVALSRAKSSNCVKILIRPSTTDSTDDHSTYNVIYDEIIQKAFSYET
ncbi:uncharacterized protein [Nicotiana tomentosiformis]|uniref:uncharacterized protein isoform X5 n=1 Tax=Nicotiana tomentosiformis TaxID=4098 RepID=UPI00388C47D5